MDTPVASPREIHLTIRNPSILEEVIAQLESDIREMRGINPNHTPIKYATKERWQSTMDRAADLLRKLLGKSE